MDKIFIVKTLLEIEQELSQHLNDTHDLIELNNRFRKFWNGVNDQLENLTKFRREIGPDMQHLHNKLLTILENQITYDNITEGIDGLDADSILYELSQFLNFDTTDQMLRFAPHTVAKIFNFLLNAIKYDLPFAYSDFIESLLEDVLEDDNGNYFSKELRFCWKCEQIYPVWQTTTDPAGTVVCKGCELSRRLGYEAD